MRAIKFRETYTYENPIGKRKIAVVYHKSLKNLIDNYIGSSFEDTAIFEQWTGFKDIKGKDIYEGDTVIDRTAYEDLWETPGIYEKNKCIIPFQVYWQAKKGCWAMRNIEHKIVETNVSELKLELIRKK